jgi:beta-glucosidase
MKIIKLFILINFIFVLNLLSQPAQDTTKSVPYKNQKLSIEERVNDLVSRMTLDEKVGQMINSAKPIDRLGVPEYGWWNEGLHGVAYSGIATVFPQAIGLAATWNDNLLNQVADIISTEFRAKFNDYQSQGERGGFKGLTVWSPNINIFRDPRWGRGQETYGEDPYLTSRMGVAFVKGMQGSDEKYFKTITTPKHYAVHSGPEPLRHQFDAVTNYRDLAETYTPAFKACIVEGGAYSVMCAYQRYLSTPCCASDTLLQKLLRDKWNFKGYVVSDCGAINDIYTSHKYVDSPEEAAAVAVKAGCDLECGDVYSNLKKAVEKDLLKESDIDVAVKRLFTARFRLGLFDSPESILYSRLTIADNDKPEHREMALKAARESIVLLKNKSNFLPLKKDIKTIAVIGPNADVTEVLYGNYNGISSRPVTVLEGIKNRAPESMKILFEPGSNTAGDEPLLSAIGENAFLTDNGNEHGLRAEYFDNMNLTGTPFLSRIDKNVYFDFINNPPLPKKDIRFSVRWTGWIVSPENDTYHFGFIGDDGYRVYLDDTLFFDNWKDHAPVFEKAKKELVKGKRYKIKIEYYQNMGAAVAKLQWGREHEDYMPLVDNAVKKADVVIYVGGLSPWLEGEDMPVDIKGFKGGDRTKLDLPEVQQNILKRIKAFGKPVALVLLSGSALSVNWEDKNVNAILQGWYPGEEGGNAIADVIFGNYNPAGRMPVTSYVSVDDLPPFENYSMKGRTYRYFSGNPLYEFGYGLSYTTFKYSNLEISKTIRTNENIKVAVEVKNTGNMDGDEVVELYVKILNAKVPAPKYALQGFKRLFLKAGEKKSVEFNLKPESFSFINNNNRRVVEPGKIQLFVGGCQPSQKAISSGNVVKAAFEIIGNANIIE